MNASVLDTITGAFVGALQAGSGALQAYSLPLLGVFAVLAFYLLADRDAVRSSAMGFVPGDLRPQANRAMTRDLISRTRSGRLRGRTSRGSTTRSS